MNKKYNEEMFLWNTLRSFIARLKECQEGDGHYFEFYKSHKYINPDVRVYSLDGEIPEVCPKTLILTKDQIGRILSSRDIAKNASEFYVEVRQRVISESVVIREIFINGLRTYCIK